MKLFFIFCLFLSISSNGQGINSKSLNVGDVIPDIEIDNIINYKTSTIRVSDFKGKLLILDFWATWCSPCIAAFPKLDSLQKKFSNDIQILPVTYEETAKVTDFINKMGRIKKLSPTSVTNDKKLSNLFSHVTLPHYVWIDGNGKVIAITESKEVTEANIKSFLQFKYIDLAVKKDDPDRVVSSILPAVLIQKPGEKKPIMKAVPYPSVRYHSILTTYMDGAIGMSSFAEDGTGVSGRNTSIKRLYQIALLGNELSLINVNTIEVDITDPVLYKHIAAKDINGVKVHSGLEALAWLKENGYCYELKVPAELAESRFSIMLNDLNNYFGALYGIEGLLVKRNAKYLALTGLPNEKSKSKGGIKNISKDKFSLKIRNGKVDDLIRELVQPLQLHPPIIDETEFTQKLDIDINCQISNLKALNEELKKYGLQLVEKEKEMNVAVIRIKKDKAN